VEILEGRNVGVKGHFPPPRGHLKESGGIEADVRREDCPEDDLSSELEALIDARLRRPVPKAKRTRLPERRRTEASRIAWRIWKNRWSFSQHKALYMDWWSSLTADEQKQAEDTAAKYSSLEEMLDEKVKGYLELGTCDDAEWLWRGFTTTIRLDVEEFHRLLDAPVRVRSRFAEQFGRTATKDLKRALGVPGHRPKTRLSKADRDADLWSRRILAFLSHTR
jgi:hypothetical protein